MSLKAKIEAVIYAAEEPITLAQLASIFSDEVFAARSASGLPFDEIQPENETAEAAESAASIEGSPEPEAAASNEGAADASASGQPSLPMEDAEARKQVRVRER
jgi:segregation and condensation protein B